VTLKASPNSSITPGSPALGEMLIESAFELLRRRLLENDFDHPRIPQTVAILPPWCDHPSFRPRPE